jgi:Chromosome segregation ATPases
MKKMIIATFVLASIANAKLPVNISVGVSSAYDKLNISQAEFKKFGLSEVVTGEYNSNILVSKANVDVTYPVKIQNLNLSFGVGIDAFVEGKITKDNIKVNIKEKSSNDRELERKTYLLNEEYENKKFTYDVAKIKYDELADISENGESKIKTLETEIAGYEKIMKDSEKAKAEYQEKYQLRDLQAKELRLKLKAIEDEVAAKQKSAEALTNQDDIDNLVTLLKQKQAEYMVLNKVYTKVVEDRQTNFSNLEELKLLPGVKKEKEKELEEYKKKMQEIGENSENIVENFEKEKMLFEEVKARKEENDKLLKQNNEENSSDKISTQIFDKLNSRINFGTSVYAIAETNFNVYNDINAYINTKIGVKLTPNQLYNVAKELENEKVEIKGSAYKVPEDISAILISPKAELGFGIKYKGFRGGLITGYNSGLIGLTLGYEF